MVASPLGTLPCTSPSPSFPNTRLALHGYVCAPSSLGKWRAWPDSMPGLAWRVVKLRGNSGVFVVH